MKAQNIIEARALKFDFRPFKKKYWYDDDPIKTLFANSICASIPYGERFVILCVMPFVKELKNRSLKKQVVNFIRQESNHATEHHRFFRHMIKPYYPELAINKGLFFKIMQIGAFLLGKKIRLAMVAAVEHLTAITGELFLKEPSLSKGINEELLLLWQWHFVEEIEHKAVAFDMLRETNCNYLTRMIGLFFVSLFMLAGFIKPFLHMVIKDKLYQKKSFYIQSFHFFWGQLGVFRKLLVPYLKYAIPYFHPNKNDNKVLLSEWNQYFINIEKRIEEKSNV